MARTKKVVRKPTRSGRSRSLEHMNYRELLALQSEIRSAIEERRNSEKRELAAKLEKLAASSGFSLPEIIGRRAQRRPGNAAAVRYRHPSNPSLTWSGRGRRPKWLNEAGRNIERYRVA